VNNQLDVVFIKCKTSWLQFQLLNLLFALQMEDELVSLATNWLY